MLETGRTNRKLIIRCMRNPGEVRLDPNAILDPIQDRWNELAQECEADNAVVELNRNDIPNWYRDQRRAANPDENREKKEETDSDSDEDEEVKFVGAILKSKSKYGGALDGSTSNVSSSKEQAKEGNKKVSNNNTKKMQMW